MRLQRYRNVAETLTSQGWRVLRQGSESHEIWCASDGITKVVVPRHREVAAGVLRRIAERLESVPGSWR